MVETGRAGSSQTPSTAITANVVFMRKQVCSSEKDHCSSERCRAGDGGISDTRKHSGCIVSIKGTYINVSVALRVLTLAHCVG